MYSPDHNSWHAPSECVWADGRIPIPDRTAISLSYPSMESFFKSILNVQSPDLSMHVRALVELSRRPSEEATRIKDAIMLISSLNPTHADLESLSACNIFHVRLANGTRQWTNKSADFAINDRAQYAHAFRDKIAMLDFTLEEVREADLFLEALGLHLFDACAPPLR